MSDEQRAWKRAAAERALDLVESGMRLGLGTGSTADEMLQALAERLRDGRLRDIAGVPTSEATARRATELGIPLTTLDRQPQLDLTLDGADEVDPQLDLIKGLGGALLREKIVASASRRMVVMADESKRVSRLGERAPLPVEIVAFGQALAERRVREWGGTPTLRRRADGTPFVTDEGHLLLDCRFGPFDTHALAAALSAVPGVVEHGLFLGLATQVVVAGPGGVALFERRGAA
jgi:ribose 5-phosphate isomerase A